MLEAESNTTRLRADEETSEARKKLAQMTKQLSHLQEQNDEMRASLDDMNKES